MAGRKETKTKKETFLIIFFNIRYVKLISSDGHEFIVKREHALTSGTIKVGRTLDSGEEIDFF